MIASARATRDVTRQHRTSEIIKSPTASNLDSAEEPIQRTSVSPATAVVPARSPKTTPSLGRLTYLFRLFFEPSRSSGLAPFANSHRS